ncbi:MAG TPA: FAD:protein FMN transferase [Myxococcota bacterium]
MALLLAALAAAGCGRPGPATEVRLSGEALGTVWAVTLASREADALDRQDLRRRVLETLDRVDRSMSHWRDDSEISRFNRDLDAGSFAFSPETRRVVAAALTLARETGGAFDPTVGPLIAAWGFGPQAAAEDPSAAQVARLRERVGWQRLAWDAQGHLVRRAPGVELDLSAIAKGYAVDAVADALAADQPAGVLVEVGGEVRAFGTAADGSPWRVGVESPVAPGAALEAVVTLTGAALATSGDYRQIRVSEGVTRSHIVDPRSGQPLSNRMASASVIAPTCMEADAVATALMVMGPDAGIAWVEERPWLEALLLVRDGDRIAERRASSGWARWVIAPD